MTRYLVTLTTDYENTSDVADADTPEAAEDRVIEGWEHDNQTTFASVHGTSTVRELADDEEV